MTLGPSEIAFVAVAGLVVVGPRGIPQLAYGAGQALGTAARLLRQGQATVGAIAREQQLHDLHAQMQRDMADIDGIRREWHRLTRARDIGSLITPTNIDANGVRAPPQQQQQQQQQQKQQQQQQAANDSMHTVSHAAALQPQEEQVLPPPSLAHHSLQTQSSHEPPQQYNQEAATHSQQLAVRQILDRRTSAFAEPPHALDISASGTDFVHSAFAARVIQLDDVTASKTEK